MNFCKKNFVLQNIIWIFAKNLGLDTEICY
jgi:hypothetical protein